MRRRLLGVLVMTLGLNGAAAAQEPAEFAVTLSQVGDRKAVFATVESLDVVPARARIGGTVRDLAVDEGSRVERGQPLAVVLDPKLAQQIAAIDARAESARSQQELAGLDLDRARKLRESGTISQARLDEARTSVDVFKQTLAGLAAERRLVLEREAEGQVLAPASGRVLQVHVTEGTVVLPGETIATVAAESYVLRLELPERHARFIGVGDEVLVGARGLDAAAAAEPRKGRVRQVYPRISRGRVVADVDVDGLGDFFVGERVRVQVETGSRPAYVVPEAFVYQRHGLSYVRLKDVGEVVVQAGLPSDGGVEILSGVREGDVLLRPESGR